MPTIPLYHDRFGPCVRLAHADADALVALRGAQVLSWRPGGEERLFLSGRPAAPEGATRGGIPVIFPQFAAEGPGPRHGFARNATWRVVESPTRHDAAVAALRLVPDAATTAAWPNAFELELTLALGAHWLELALLVRNPGGTPWTFAAALHTYLAVDDPAPPVPHALATHPFDDRTEAGCAGPATGPLDTRHEIERLYRGVPARLDWPLSSPLRLCSEGWPDLMVWNPGDAKAAKLPDLAPGDHRRFLCVEPLQHHPLTLAPGAHWRATHRLSVPAP